MRGGARQLLSIVPVRVPDCFCVSQARDAATAHIAPTDVAVRGVTPATPISAKGYA